MKPGLLAVRAHRLFDGFTVHDGPVSVYIDERKIIDIDFTGAEAPTGFAVDDFGDATLMPGLIDAHSHLSFDTGRPLDLQMGLDSDSQITSRIHRNAALALSAGVTTIRDLGDRGYLTLQARDSGNHHTSPTAEILAAGPPLTSRAGHCASLGGEVGGLAEITQSITDHADAGVDLVKIMATGGMGADPARTQFAHAELSHAVQTTHAYGLPIVAHAHASQGIRSAIDAGVDGIEHCSFMTTDGVRRDQQIVDDLAASDIFIGCTVAQPRPDMPPSVLATLEPYWANNSHMHACGVNVVCCTDAGINSAKPHDVLPRDLIYFASQVGTTIDALRSATSLAAKSCGLAHRKGRVAPGYDGDLLVSSGNPATQIRDLLSLVAVYRKGLRLSSTDASDRHSSQTT